VLGFFLAGVFFAAAFGLSAFFFALLAKILSQLSEKPTDDPVCTV
jgi:hypothetical protein